jgi:hypothetical protein
MAKAVGVGQVAEWFKATVLKTPQGLRQKAPNSRISNSFRPRIRRTKRISQRFAMAQMSAHINRPAMMFEHHAGLTNNAKELRYG